MGQNIGPEKRKRKSPYLPGTRPPKRNARLTSEQAAEHEARLQAEMLRIENALLDRLVNG